MERSHQVNLSVVEEKTKKTDESVRIDLWAWATRLYKSRTLAAAACKKSQLLVNGQRCRASRRLRLGDEVSVRQGLLTRTFEVTELLHRRVSAKVVDRFRRDLTPPEEYARVAELNRLHRESVPFRESGTGRPTKRERRELEEFEEHLASELPSSEPTFDEFVKAFNHRPSSFPKK